MLITVLVVSMAVKLAEFGVGVSVFDDDVSVSIDPFSSVVCSSRGSEKQNKHTTNTNTKNKRENVKSGRTPTRNKRGWYQT